jgi:hypothetical protein
MVLQYLFLLWPNKSTSRKHLGGFIAHDTTVSPLTSVNWLVAAEGGDLGNPTFSGVATVPGPIAGAGLPGLIAACGGLFALARRRRKLVV